MTKKSDPQEERVALMAKHSAALEAEEVVNNQRKTINELEVEVAEAKQKAARFKQAGKELGLTNWGLQEEIAFLERDKLAFELACKEVVRLGKKACVLCPLFQNNDCVASFINTQGCIDTFKNHYLARAGKEIAKQQLREGEASQPTKGGREKSG